MGIFGIEYVNIPGGQLVIERRIGNTDDAVQDTDDFQRAGMHVGRMIYNVFN
jgi:hypothetical protein